MRKENEKKIEEDNSYFANSFNACCKRVGMVGLSFLPNNGCSGNHTLSSGNMVAVASYGNKDYYTCKRCRYVAPFDSIVAQNYTYQQDSDSMHKVTNNVTGLNYTFYEEHHYSYTYLDNRSHRGVCDCGKLVIGGHYANGNDIIGGRYVTCMGCNTLLDLHKDMANLVMSPNTQVSVNGSYILPSGIVILVEEDIEAYENGTLQFYNQSDLPSVS